MLSVVHWLGAQNCLAAAPESPAATAVEVMLDGRKMLLELVRKTGIVLLDELVVVILLEMLDDAM